MRYKCVRFSMILGQTVIPGVQAVVVVVPAVVDAVHRLLHLGNLAPPCLGGSVWQQVHHIPEQEDGGVLKCFYL